MAKRVFKIARACLVGAFLLALAWSVRPGSSAGAAADDGYPPFLDVTGIVRDFQEKTEPDGHPDFENYPDQGMAHYCGNIATTLGADRKPVWVGGGFKVSSQWRDSEHRPICYAMYDPALGDIEGSAGQTSTGGVTDDKTFNQWYRDQPGINISAPLTVRLVRQADGSYVFDDRKDPLYAKLGGFFPIDDKMFGNSAGEKHNFDFTFELHMDCEYDAAKAQFFKFVGDDDVYIFVNDRLVVDLGGVHAAHDQYIDMDRLGLADGETYRIDFFFAERYQPQSNFRIETNIPVRTPHVPSVTTGYD